jgi:hypothetical protein
MVCRACQVLLLHYKQALDRQAIIFELNETELKGGKCHPLNVCILIMGYLKDRDY